jgi:hypothetical protein
MLAIEPPSKSGGINSAGRFEINFESIRRLIIDKRKGQGYSTLAFGVGAWNAAESFSAALFSSSTRVH